MKNEGVDSTWKQMTSQAGLMATRPRVDPYSKVVLNGDNNLGLGGVIYADQNQQNNMINMNGSFNMTQQTQAYNIPQPSPDSTGLANMNIASPLMDQNSLDTIDQMLASNGAQNETEVENLSGKLGDMSFGAPLNIQPAGPATRTGGKRSSKDAENESGSAIVPRQMERQQSSITT